MHRTLFLLMTLLCFGVLQAEVLLWRPPIQLATDMPEDINVSDYLISEKLDGVRGYWDGSALYTRSGNMISVPVWFSRDFPAYPLDGELWLGRNRFHKMLSLIKQTNPDPQLWRSVRFMVFDLPASTQRFNLRYHVMQAQLKGLSAFLEVIPQYTLKSQKELDTLFIKTIELGGEGLMLHEKTALYQIGRSNKIIKLKPIDEAKAKVVGYQAGKGKFSGMMGALLVTMPNGKPFKLGTGFSDAQRQNPPKMGTQVIYQYRGVTHKGIPRFASFLSVSSESQSQDGVNDITERKNDD
ncbi:DNA ligase [Shewanella surugensis]|uniref:DNA ligase n=1 Tax=Shewanella surugensis TaxID=212020 RepID=A0ABT0L9F3_9GAMM|nr:DNA ligase [Shewanella surugensis]MCL1124179.1 DNA ligase [Shewanella surugensis]